ncbi:hypothetical protein HNQ77_001156 [Silvibacterium bohemicum]|uniref:Uncharacterized protein n=1 Tax=Silvibacterium bohemicum TaxID=1577686 RepID=A0A841JPB9_9BACT|nr:hypothetical protein [Silvibacterium bohemicum]MBB6143212.1 hypothetical protein [Silvibacterium bohemicum]
MQVTDLGRWLWAAGFIGHILLFTVLIVRSRAQQFPIFTTFVLSNLVRTVVLFFILKFGSRHTYYYTFWSLGALDTLLQFGIVYEMYAKTFRPLGVWASDVRRAFLSLIFGSLIIAFGLTMAAAPHTKLPIQSTILRADFFSSVWMGELFVGMISISVKAGLPWQAHVGRIAKSLGLYCLLDTLIGAMATHFGLDQSTAPYLVLQQIRQFLYLGCLSYWIVMLWKEAPDPRRMSDELRLRLIRLQARVEADLHWIRARHPS